MRRYPLEYEKKREVLYYPERPSKIAGDFFEIGPGNGQFLISLAQNHPRCSIVALELDKGRYYRIRRRLMTLGIDNVLLICGNARTVIPERFTQGVFERLYVLFPDPWPKRRHALNRLMTSEFLPALEGLLRPGGYLYFATDVEPYARSVAKILVSSKSFTLTGDPFSSADAVADYRPTFFESVALRDGASIFYLAAQKR